MDNVWKSQNISNECENTQKTVVPVWYLFWIGLYCIALGDARVCCLPSRLFMITVIIYISISFDAKITNVYSFRFLNGGCTAFGISSILSNCKNIKYTKATHKCIHTNTRIHISAFLFEVNDVKTHAYTDAWCS